MFTKAVLLNFDDTKVEEVVVNNAVPGFDRMPDAVIYGHNVYLKTDDPEGNVYKQCFAMLTGATWKEYEAKEAEDKEKPLHDENGNRIYYGDDRHLTGLPANLEEAIDTLKTFYTKEIEDIKGMVEDEFTAVSHHHGGQFIRNTWFLWWNENHTYDGWPKTIPPLVKYFHDLGITHADDMSGIIMTSMYRNIKGLPLDVEGQVKKYKDFWEREKEKNGGGNG